MSSKVKKTESKSNAKDNKSKPPTSIKKSASSTSSSTVKKSSVRDSYSHLFEKNSRHYGIGRAIPHKMNLSRFVLWPTYIRLQRQRAILKKRLKVPPALNQFNKTLEKNHAATLFKFLAHYRPESRDEKKKRLFSSAKAESKNEEKKDGGKPFFVKFGLNHVTRLIESKSAKLVIIAHDVDPIELVVWIPALCRKLNVPYVIVKGKARLGHLIHHKVASVLAVTDVRKEDSAKFDQLQTIARTQYNDDISIRRKWGGGVMGIKHDHEMKRREKVRLREAAKAHKI